MAKKKSQTPRPPKTPGARPVQAPKVRSTPRAPRPVGRRVSRLWLIGSGVAVAVVVIVVLLATMLGGGSDASALASAGCVQQTFADQGRQHVEELPADFKYNSFPATSGRHHFQAAIWNIYTETVPEINLVHNLEHGGVIVQYGDQVPSAEVDQIGQWYAEGDRNGIIVAPLAALGDRVALTAWTKLATCTGFDGPAFDAFVDLHRYSGPERLPESAMQQGT